jgi:plasmid stabilization system protein ParE
LKTYQVIFSSEAEEQLASLYLYIAVEASPNIAERYTDAIVTFCEGLTTFPHRGNCRDEIRPGLRITNYRRRTAIAFEVSKKFVSIIGIFMAVKIMKRFFRQKTKSSQLENIVLSII